MSLKLSVCIPTYHRPGELAQCLKSVLEARQGLEDYVEIVVTDNGQDDATWQLGARLAESTSNFVYWRNDRNVGAEMNYQVAANKAKAPHLWLLGSDDGLRRQAISQVLNAIEQREDVFILQT